MKRVIRTAMLMPAYMQQFRCIGPECEDSCCTASWRIDLDRETFHDYKATRHPDLVLLMADGLKRNRGKSGSQYGQIRVQPGAAFCPMRTEDSLCKVQSCLGEDALSDTCFTYPRYTSSFNNVLQQAATLSCPAAAALALASPMAMHWREVPGVVRESSLKTMYAEHPQAVQQAVQDVHYLCVQLLLEPELELWQALAVVGLLCQQLTPLAKQGMPLDKVLALTAGIRALLESGQLLDDLSATIGDAEAQGQVAATVLLLGRNRLREQRHPRFAAVMARFRKALGESVDEVAQHYPMAASNWQQRADAASLAHGLRNYLANYMLLTRFPFDQNDSAEDAYTVLVTLFVVMRALFVALAEDAGEARLEDMVQAVQTFDRVCRHDEKFIRQLAEAFANTGYRSLSRLYPLLRDAEKSQP